ncbi:uncharacterized protein cubi_01549 [Cryptosporidium ubiquitum]|uniref:Uncharacterized protein n=1 Tax=Cryptosporidium ubiquitum TaxID=857276 RepID=A0A1J4MDA2_9CRYT|nr:uncharacterized protein cubi_01549 [Cryptosporidium ubiquitum]OII72216.1 hypothetical protein cubi_01549 [Cryptosporidium ubiquitum]
MPSFIPSIRKEEEEENLEECVGISLQDELLNKYFEELSSLIEELKKEKNRIQEGMNKYTEQEKAKCYALILSSQRMLEIIYFEIHFSESNTRNYQDFQNYLKYKENLSQINEDFSKFTVFFDPNKDSKNEDKTEETSNLPFKDVISHSSLEVNIKDNKLYHHQIMEEKSQDYYLLQSKRLLEETNQYSQQVLLNLNTQKEQLMGTDNKIKSISKNIQDSSLILDKMTKWWHQFI